MKCLKLNLPPESICEIYCLGCAMKLSHGINPKWRDICVCCFDAVFVDKTHNLYERLQNVIKFNQYCKNDQEEQAFSFFVDVLDYYTNFSFVHARNQRK